MAAKALGPHDPPAAYERMIQHLAVVAGSSEVRGERFYRKVSALFERKGGSWSDLFEGSGDQLTLLKAAVRYCIKQEGRKGGK